MKRQVWLGLGGVVLLGAGAAIGWSAKPSALNARLYAQNRLIAVQVHLEEAPPDYILIAGDSQAELQDTAQRTCELEIVNGGLSGATAAVYADLFQTLKVPVRARVAALTVGTNDLNRKGDPTSTAGAARFTASVERIVRELQAVSARVVVTAVPPIGREVGNRLDPAAVGVYSRAIRDLCQRIGCDYADPFAHLRDGDTGYALPGALRDGLHVAGYRSVQRALEPALCPGNPG
ncbi:SGNH/GDSL hydrolase family protein [Methylobacterium sp. BTF04]|uniref:SGNH/GDSL hydrolase family protein n=1 Tax=Methylobacterium sp. BTF04 TaxID=2708300 RepID=UPI0013D49A83|nr:SGNH/GDSL hydrolase family protein [Methylobacterium sp. BTF04]NEU12458.1 SGNH/GDSL hydrolase family protein [Methylobacterium sp. BTF04]